MLAKVRAAQPPTILVSIGIAVLCVVGLRSENRYLCGPALTPGPTKQFDVCQIEDEDEKVC